MGFLHEGHLELVRCARARAEQVVVSLFVNPLQFNRQDDFDAYPRDTARDLALLEPLGVDVVFVPDAAELYPAQFASAVTVGSICEPWEGAFRPGHFRGVTTVVAMLFNLVRPDLALFGEKDFQQVRVIETMVEELHFPVQIVRIPTVREADGLAMSSRNVRLSVAGRQVAPAISAALFAAQAQCRAGERRSEELESLVRAQLAPHPIEIEYVAVVRERDLMRTALVEPPARVLFAGYLEKVRLIDNVSLSD